MRLYRILLYLFPSAFRAEYGPEMCWVFSQKRKDATSLPARFILWVGTFFEVVTNAIRVHWDIFKQDLAYTMRTLRRGPGFTITAILVIGLGVGATTASFSIADHVLIRPLPFPDWQRLVKLWETPPGGYRNEASPPNYTDWKRMSKSFESMGAYNQISMNLTGQGDPERLEGSAVSSEIIQTLRIQPMLGHRLVLADDSDKTPLTILLSYGLWQTKFNGDPGVLGKKVLLDDEPYVVIGVMPRGFYFPDREGKFWIPLRIAQDDFEDRDNNFLKVLAKLKKNVSLEEAQAEMRVIAAQLEKEYPEENAKTGVGVVLLRDEVSRQARFLLMALVGASLCVLLIACSNLANLLIARALARKKELAVRTALGAGRERLVRQLLTESLVLAVIGGAIGIFLAFTVTPLLARLVPNSLPIAESPSMNLRILLFSALATGLTGIGFGVIPAFKISRETDSSGLHEGARSGVGGRKERLRSALIVA
jgi:predicted permease